MRLYLREMDWSIVALISGSSSEHAQLGRSVYDACSGAAGATVAGTGCALSRWSQDVADDPSPEEMRNVYAHVQKEARSK